MSSVSPNVPRTTNVLSFMNVEGGYVHLLKSVGRTMTAPLMSLVQQPFPTWDKGSAKMSAKALSFVEGMLSANQATTGQFVPAQMGSLATQKMTKWAAKRSSALPTQIVLETAFAQTSDALHLCEPAALSTEIVDRMKPASMVTVSTPVTTLQHVESMPFAMFSTTRRNALAQQDSLAMMKLNVSGFPTPA